MAVERRCDVVLPGSLGQPRVGVSPSDQTKPFKITRREVYGANKRVKVSGGVRQACDGGVAASVY